MTCLTCAHLDLRTYPKHATTGYGRCDLDPRGTFTSIKSTCDKHQPVGAEAIFKRETWAERL